MPLQLVLEGVGLVSHPGQELPGLLRRELGRRGRLLLLGLLASWLLVLLAVAASLALRLLLGPLFLTVLLLLAVVLLVSVLLLLPFLLLTVLLLLLVALLLATLRLLGCPAAGG